MGMLCVCVCFYVQQKGHKFIRTPTARAPVPPIRLIAEIRKILMEAPEALLLKLCYACWRAQGR